MSNEDKAWSKKHYNIEDIGEYDLKPTPFIDKHSEFLLEKNIKKVLDAGCGQGRNSLYLANQGFNVISVDSSENALKLCAELLEKKGHVSKTIHNRLQNLENVETKSIDAIISTTVLTHIANNDIGSVIGEFYRVLNKKGYLIADFANHKDSTYEYISKGKKIEDNVFLENGTIVAYRNKDEVENLFNKDKWEIILLKDESFIEPPHPGSRSFEHEHNSYVVLAQKK